MAKYFLILVLFFAPITTFGATITTTSSTGGVSNFNYPSGGGGAVSLYKAQSFVATADGTITSLVVNIGYNNNGTPDGDCRISIYSNSAGVPGTELAFGSPSTGSMPSDGTTADMTVTLDTSPSVTNGTTYWILYGGGTATPSNLHYFLIGGDNPNTYGSFLGGDSIPPTTSVDRTGRAVITITTAATVVSQILTWFSWW